MRLKTSITNVDPAGMRLDVAESRDLEPIRSSCGEVSIDESSRADQILVGACRLLERSTAARSPQPEVSHQPLHRTASNTRAFTIGWAQTLWTP